MKKNLLKYAAGLLLSSAFLVIGLSASLPVSAQTYDAAAFRETSGLDKAAGAAGYATGGDATSLNDLIGTIIYAFLGLVGVVFLVLVIYGGLTWMTAQGNEEKVKKANGIISGSLIGLIVTLAAYVISYFLINYFQTGALG